MYGRTRQKLISTISITLTFNCSICQEFASEVAFAFAGAMQQQETQDTWKSGLPLFFQEK